MVEIREHDPARDRPAVRACFVELQDFERGLDPRMPPGDPVADAYLELTFRRCDEFGGVVLVADVEGRVVREYTVAPPSGFLLRFAQDVEPDVP